MEMSAFLRRLEDWEKDKLYKFSDTKRKLKL